MMKRAIYILTLLIVACTQPGYPDVDNPQQGGSADDRKIIDYIDQRLSQEYYWLDEVVEKSDRFNRNLKWENYLDSSLAMLPTNTETDISTVRVSVYSTPIYVRISHLHVAT